MTISEIFTNLDNQCSLSISSINFVNKSEYLATEELRNVLSNLVFLKVLKQYYNFLDESQLNQEYYLHP